MKQKEAELPHPGISVLKAESPGVAAAQMRAAFPRATRIHELADIVGTSSEAAIRSVGFEIVKAETKTFPNHYRIIHPTGVEGFTDDSLARLASVFVNSSGHST